MKNKQEAKKDVYEELKGLVDYNDEIFQKDGTGLLGLERKIRRNNSYAKLILYITKKSIVKNQQVTLKEMSSKIEQSDNYTYKIIQDFISEELIIISKMQNKNYYYINMDDERLKEFMYLFKVAKGMMVK